MGIIQKQGMKSSLFIMIGFVIGAFNLLVLFPLFFSKTDQGLVRAMIDIGATLSIFCTLGTLPVVYKFYPFYNQYLGPKKNELPFITLMVNLIGFGLILIIGWVEKDFIIRKLGKSPDLAVYFDYVYPYTFFFLIFLWLESFAWGLRKGVTTNFLKETLIRILTTILILAYGLKFIDLPTFIMLFSGIYLIPVLLLTNNFLAKTNDTFLIFGLRGLSDTAIFAIATYVSAILEIPQRSLNSITIPVLAESWKNKDMANIKHVYHKSVSNLLAIGLLLFGLIWLNIENLVAFLNWVSHKQGGGYEALTKLIFILGLAKLIDLGTGVNSQIIGTSNYWKFDFYTNLFYIILSLPLNYFLIKNYGLEGLAFSNLVALTIYNSIRFGFLYKKFNLQPYTWRHGVFLLSSIGLMLLIHLLPSANNFAVNILIQSFAFGITFYGLAYWINPAPEILDFFNDFIRNKIPGFFNSKSKS